MTDTADVPDDEQPLSDRVFDLLVYLPVGVVVTVVEEVPNLAARGRERIGVQVDSAKSVGRFVVRAGGHELKRRSPGRRGAGGESRASSGDSPDGGSPTRLRTIPRGGSQPPAPSVAAPERPQAVRTAPAGGAHIPAVSALAIPGFDTLSASHVVQRLDGLNRTDLVAVRAYEAATPRAPDDPRTGWTNCSTSGPEPAGDVRAPTVVREHVRVASVEDLDRLVELTAGFRQAAVSRRGGATSRVGDPGGSAPEASATVIATYLSDPERTALVGLVDEWVAGAALCRSDGHGRDRRGVLDVCFVEPGVREVGLGGLLLEHALDWFRAQGCTGVDGTALPGDRGAKQFFESAGFKARLLVMHLPLD